MPLATVAPAGSSTSTGRASCPSQLISEVGGPDARPISYPNSNPGIRRPRWGGVVEGVAGQIRHPLAYDRGEIVSGSHGGGRWMRQIGQGSSAIDSTGYGVTDAHLCGYSRARAFGRMADAQPDRVTMRLSGHRGRPRRRRLSGQGVPRSRPCCRCRHRWRRRPGAGARRPIRRAHRRSHVAQARRALGDRRPARQGDRDARADPFGARPGR